MMEWCHADILRGELQFRVREVISCVGERSVGAGSRCRVEIELIR